MKKTIIVLAALSGMAFADVSQDIIYKEITSTYTLNPETSKYGLTYAIDLSKAWTVTVTGTADLSQHFNQYGTLPVSMDSNTVYGQSEPIRMYLSAQKQIVVRPYGEKKYSLTEGTGDIVDYIITMSYNPDGAGTGNGRIFLDASITDNNEHITTISHGDQYWTRTLTGTCEELYGALNAATQTNWTTPTITVTQMIAVPEPATATLSLLALAGLAARRRRR